MNKQQYSYTYTVFTPTYNRANTLHRAYAGLQAQTFRDFEWVIVDDGSTDNTRELVEQWQREADFPIRYIYQPNQGKHMAINHGVQEARGTLFVVCDSDDALLPTALERMKYHWEQIPAEQRAQFAGVEGFSVDPSGNVVGTRFPQDILDSNNLEIFYRYKMRGDKDGFYLTDILKAYPFPKVSNTTFLPESTVWDRIARRYKKRYVNEAFRTIYFDQSVSLTRSKNPARHAITMSYHYLRLFNEDLDWLLRYRPVRFFSYTIKYVRQQLHARVDIPTQLARIHHPFVKLVVMAMIPAGIAAYLRDRWRMQRLEIET